MLLSNTKVTSKLADADQPASVLIEDKPEGKALAQLKAAFDSAEPNGDHKVSKAKLTAALDRREGLANLIKEAGFNRDYNLLHRMEAQTSNVTWDEFLAYLMEAPVGQLPADEKALQRLKQIFHRCAADATDAVSVDELAIGLTDDVGVGGLLQEADFNPKLYILQQLDTHGEGQIKWEEFAIYLGSTGPPEERTVEELTATTVLEQEQQQQGLQPEELGGANAAIAPTSMWCSGGAACGY